MLNSQIHCNIYILQKHKHALAAHSVSDIIELCHVSRVLRYELLRQYFVMIHNSISIIHANVCVVYLIVLLTIKSNFLKILKDMNLISLSLFQMHSY